MILELHFLSTAFLTGLVRSNWVRTSAWSVRVVLVFSLLRVV